jgi:hypothetical protein
MFRLIVLTALLLILTGCSPEPQPTQPEETGNEVSPGFNPDLTLVADKLDTDGAVFSVADGQYELQGMKPLLDLMLSSFTIAAREGELGPEADKIMAGLETLPQRLGLTEILARGQSTKSLPGGGFRSIQILQPTAGASGLLWNLQGDSFSIQEEMSRMPANTALLFRFSINAPMLRDLIKETISTYAPEALSDYQQGENMVKAMGIPLEDILKSLKSGVTFGLTLNPDNMLMVPMSGVSVPEPGLILQLEDPNGSLNNLVTLLLGSQLPPPFQFVASERGGVTVNRIAALPVPVPAQINPQVALLGTRLAFATSDAAMDELIARQNGDQTSPLQSRMDGLGSDQAYQLWVVTPEFEALVKTGVEQAMSMAQMAEPGMAGFFEAYIGLFANAFPRVLASRIEDGMSITTLLHDKPMMAGAGANSGAALTVAPMMVGMMAAIAVPSFQQAREVSSQNACINNLRMLEGATDQWAIENNKMTGDTVTRADIQVYLRRWPECPQGGTYTFGTVGTSPVCSIHGSLD